MVWITAKNVRLSILEKEVSREKKNHVRREYSVRSMDIMVCIEVTAWMLSPRLRIIAPGSIRRRG